MKKALWVLAALAVVAGAGLIFIAYSVNSLATRYKPDIEQAASTALHASVSLGEISASVFPTITVRVHEARIASAPGSIDAVSLQGLVLHVKLLPLLARRLVIETVGLDTPSLTVVRTKGGIFLEGLPAREGTAPPADAASAPPSASRVSPLTLGGATAAALTIDLRNFEITDGTLTLRDAVDDRTLALSNIDVRAVLSLAGTIATIPSVRARATLPDGSALALTASGLSFDAASGQVVLGTVQATVPGGAVAIGGTVNASTRTGKVTLTSDGVQLAPLLKEVAGVAPAARDVKVGGAVKPELTASFGPDTYSASGSVALDGIALQRAALAVADIAGSVALTAHVGRQTASTEGLTFTFKDKPGKLQFTAVLEGDQLHIEPLALSALSGSLSGTFDSSVAAPQRFTTRLDGSGFSVADALPIVSPRLPLHVDGTISKLGLHVSGRGTGDVAQSLEGTVAFAMTDAIVKDVNVVALVMEGVGRVPLFAGAVNAPSLKKHLSSRHTAISSLTGDFTMRSGWLETNNLRMVSDLFTLSATGRVSFESDLDMEAVITFSKAVSEDMLRSVKELRPVLNDGLLSIPFTAEGRPPKVKIRPDVTKLIEASTRGALQGAVGEALKGALTGEKAGGKLLDRLFGK